MTLILRLKGYEDLGESQVNGYKKDMQVDSCSWGVSQAGTWHQGGGGGGMQPHFGDVTVTRLMDKASPTLFLQCANGTHIPEGKIFFLISGQQPEDPMILQYEVTLYQIIVSSSQWSSTGGRPMESLSLNFHTAVWEWKEQSKTGVAGAGNKKGWSVPQNKATTSAPA